MFTTGKHHFTIDFYPQGKRLPAQRRYIRVYVIFVISFLMNFFVSATVALNGIPITYYERSRGTWIQGSTHTQPRQ